MMANVHLRRLSASPLVRLMACVSAVLLTASMSPSAHPHPHDEREILEVKGTVTKVDLVNRVLEVDIFDRTTQTTRSMLLVIDKKVKIRNGKRRIELAALPLGQRVTCSVEREHLEGRGPRLTVFDIRLDARS